MQVADIRERLDEAKQQEGTSKLDSLKASFNQKKAEGERKKAKAEEAARELLFQFRFPLMCSPNDRN